MPDNREVSNVTVVAEAPTARAPALRPLRLGRYTIDTPAILAPMAGVTNRAFRRLCREHGGGLFISEMVTSRALVEANPESMRLIEHDPDETIRSVQLYGVEPATVARAVHMLVDHNRADHIDLNFGCPVPKVTRHGGGAALPWKSDLYTAIVAAALRAAQPAGVPVTVKMRLGIDAEHLTYLDPARAAADLGVAAFTLHARTAAQSYSGTADWDAIARLRAHVPEIPVLGNGDIWSAEDALAMIAYTGVDGVVIGRGCQGRPWLFADLTAAMAGRPDRHRPGLERVAETIYRHAQLLVDTFADQGKALRDLRKHMAWYVKGYPVGRELRARLARVSTLVELAGLLEELDPRIPYPGPPAEGPRGRAGGPRKVALPEGWLNGRQLSERHRQMIAAAEVGVSGG